MFRFARFDDDEARLAASFITAQLPGKNDISTETDA
jgi:hypothetical protein